MSKSTLENNLRIINMAPIKNVNTDKQVNLKMVQISTNIG